MFWMRKGPFLETPNYFQVTVGKNDVFVVHGIVHSSRVVRVVATWVGEGGEGGREREGEDEKQGKKRRTSRSETVDNGIYVHIPSNLIYRHLLKHSLPPSSPPIHPPTLPPYLAKAASNPSAFLLFITFCPCTS